MADNQDANQDAIELRRRARRRLVGAIALVVFVVIALPIVFDREPKSITQDLTIQIPSQDSGKFSSRVIPPQAEIKGEAKAPVPAAGIAATGSPGATATISSPAPAIPATAAPAAKAATKAPEIKAEQKTVAKVDAKPTQPVPAPVAQSASPVTAKSGPAAQTAPAPPGAESFVVPLGLFRNPGNVQKVRAWVTSAGFKSFTETVSESNGVKVMAGPFASRETAEKARDKLKSKGVDVGPVAAR